MTKKDFKVIADGLKKSSLCVFEDLVENNPENKFMVIEVLTRVQSHVVTELKNKYKNFDEAKFVEYLFNASEFNDKYPELNESKGRRNN